tara:strand:+ start:7218 stop:7421 length:204 start_codon:yes stop_codon:yes gene_type:complete
MPAAARFANELGGLTVLLEKFKKISFGHRADILNYKIRPARKERSPTYFESKISHSYHLLSFGLLLF